MASFPLFTNAVTSQYPGYSETDVFATLEGEVDGVFTTTACLNPTNRIRRFQISMEQMSRPELITLESFFLSVGGTTMSWSFTDDKGNVYPNCRFVDERIPFQYQEQNSYGVTLEIEQIVTGT